MTIDERLDRLTERHEALTQTVELLIHAQEDAHRRHEEAYRVNEEAQAKNQVLIAQVIESVDSLSRIAHLHERRISDLEDRNSQ